MFLYLWTDASILWKTQVCPAYSVLFNISSSKWRFGTIKIIEADEDQQKIASFSLKSINKIL